MKHKKYFSTNELAKILGISRIAVFKKIKRGEIKAVKVGRNFVIQKEDLGGILDEELTKKDKIQIEKAVKKVAKEYRETLKLLAEND